MAILAELNASQKSAMQQFYDKPFRKVLFDKNERKKIWEEFKKDRNLENFSYLKECVPAIFAEMSKALFNDKKVQPGVFSECVYSQAMASMYELEIFKNHIDNHEKKFDFRNTDLHKVKDLTIRYSYTSTDGQVSLVQAGGAGGVDCALISFEKQITTMIELKEPYARTSAPDLPKYGEDGFLITTEKFESNYPQFKSMLQEQIEKGLNVFESMGNNVSSFSKSSIEIAVTNNYSGEKFADFICTEDVSGYLVMLPSKHLSIWGDLEGEIRPTGRNSYPVWTPNKLINTIKEKSGSVKNDLVKIPLSSLKTAKARGGNQNSRYKISPLFFVRYEDAIVKDNFVMFNINSVEQNNPDITAKVNFKKLNIVEVKKFYEI